MLRPPPPRKQPTRRPQTTQGRAAGPQTTKPTFDIISCAVEPSGLVLLTSLVVAASNQPGPIIEIGTLAGISTTHIALYKRPGQQLITVDNYSWNPWGLSKESHFSIAQTVLRYLVEKGEIQQIVADKLYFYDEYHPSEPPALFFTDAMHTYDDVMQDVAWARKVGAQVICGHDYCDEFPGVKQAVDELGGYSQLQGRLWVLKS